jgi:hypothetical protein
MKKTLHRIDAVHQKLIDIITPIEPESFSRRPAKDEWSVAEIVQHLALVEERVIQDLEKATANGPQRAGFLKRLIPTSIVASRMIRVKSPRAVRPVAVLDKDNAIESLQQARNSLKAFCATHDKNRLRNLVFKHPFLGNIDGVATISFVGYHEQRHYKQIREVLRKIRTKQAA